MRLTVRDLQAMKRRGERIAMVTAYDSPSAALVERAGLPVILVGDSLGQVVLGHGTTLPVTLDDMIRHAAAVVRGCQTPLVIGDLPFLTYATLGDAVTSARRMMQEAGVQAVKLEGGGAMVPVIAGLTGLGVPVMGHLGFTPQSTHVLGARAQAKDVASARRLLEDAQAIEAAGAFGLVLELVPTVLAEAVSRRLSIPVIGIGAGEGCDGQVQVWHDLLGLFEDRPPRHAKVFAEVGQAIEAALRTYADEVKSGAFPTDLQSVSVRDLDMAAVLAETKA